MIAGLIMYDRPETADANDRLWQLIRQELAARDIPAPTQLTRDMDPWAMWQRDDLVFAQTCGLPYRTRLHEHVDLIGTPVYDLPCEPGYYFSVIVARRTNPRTEAAKFDGATLAVNEGNSQSGWAAPVAWAESSGITFGSTIMTGAHLASARAVADGRADLAALDALTWQMIDRWDEFAADLTVIARTDPTPTLPYITAGGTGSDAKFQAVQQAIAALGADDRACLGLNGFIRIAAERYLAVPTPPSPNPAPDE